MPEDRSIWKRSAEELRERQERQRSSAAGPHDPRPNRRRTRSDSDRHAIDDSRND